MPLYDYSCPSGHTVEERRGYDERSILCPLCGAIALRQAVYFEQFTITETGGLSGPATRRRRDHAGEKLNRLRKSSVETKRETGTESGPFKIRDWEL